MRQLEDLSHLNRLFASHREPLTLTTICDQLECSPATAKRRIRDLRERWSKPIVFDHDAGGYRVDAGASVHPGHELPGLWLTEAELTALLTMDALLAGLGSDLLDRQLAPFRERIAKILRTTGVQADEVARRIRILSMATRPVDSQVFGVCADAVLGRRRLEVHYTGRGRGGPEELRRLSPQRLVHYRDNWYLDAWCHQRDELRIFALDQMRAPRTTEDKAQEVAEDVLDRELASAFGIFSGVAEHEAVLRFTERRARWVAKEIWHPAQKGCYLDDGRWELRVPYAAADELVMDILKYGPDCEVLAPESLRTLVGARLAEAAAIYGATGGAIAAGSTTAVSETMDDDVHPTASAHRDPAK
jgi:proteasome accessory factor C